MASGDHIWTCAQHSFVWERTWDSTHTSSTGIPWRMYWATFHGTLTVLRASGQSAKGKRQAIVAHVCGDPLSRYTCHATLSQQISSESWGSFRCSSAFALHPPPPKKPCRTGRPSTARGVTRQAASEKVSRYRGGCSSYTCGCRATLCNYATSWWQQETWTPLLMPAEHLRKVPLNPGHQPMATSRATYVFGGMGEYLFHSACLEAIGFNFPSLVAFQRKLAPLCFAFWV